MSSSLISFPPPRDLPLATLTEGGGYHDRLRLITALDNITPGDEDARRSSNLIANHSLFITALTELNDTNYRRWLDILAAATNTNPILLTSLSSTLTRTPRRHYQ
ncbi:hypothetical protein AGMMS49593_03170 [Endomicrobiia bacterium]|nr:hypothetical protein AGMMS49593_03170 [Endomicrobiia bacterium]